MKTTEQDPTKPEALALPSTPSVAWLHQTLTPDQKKTLLATVAPKANDDELAVFLWSSRRRGLDPFLKQIHFVKRRRRSGRNGPDGKPEYEEYAVHQTGIDGFRVIANRAKDETGKRLLAGIKRGPIKDEKGVVVGAWAEVYRHDWREPARHEIAYAEYVQTDYNGNPTGLWKTGPQMMCEKCAEAGAHRMAFPEDTADLYLNEEMDQAEHIEGRDERGTTPSSATAPQGTFAEKDKPGAGVVIDAKAEVVEANGADPFAEEPPANPLFAESSALLSEIRAVMGTFKTQPAPEKFRLLTKYCLLREFDTPAAITLPEGFDPSVVRDFLTFLKALKAGDRTAGAKYLEIVNGKKVA